MYISIYKKKNKNVQIKNNSNTFGLWSSLLIDLFLSLCAETVSISELLLYKITIKN